jgi:hypothetical protein
MDYLMWILLNKAFPIRKSPSELDKTVIFPIRPCDFGCFLVSY